jgi:hypothetical protein
MALNRGSRTPSRAPDVEYFVGMLPRSIPAIDVPILALAALGVVGTKRKDIELAVFAWRDVMVRIVPRVCGHLLFAKVGTVPVCGARGLFNQGAEALFTGWVATDVKSIHIERRRQFFNLKFCGLGLRFAKMLDNLGAHKSCEKANDGQYNEQFNKGERSQCLKGLKALGPEVMMGAFH